MSQQTTLTSFFKTIGSPPLMPPLIDSNSSMKTLRILSDQSDKKKRSLTLKKDKTSSISIKTTQQINEDVISAENIAEIITVSSEEDEPTPSKRRALKLPNNENVQTPSNSQSFAHQIQNHENNNENLLPLSTPGTQSANSSNSSASTFVYNLSPGIVYQSPCPTTPSSKTSKSPGSSGKFYSPNKKRLVNKKSPVKRNLASQFNENFQPETFNDSIKQAEFTKFKDDKTLFLVTIIIKYLENDNLKHLLEEKSQELLEKCMNLVEPGMKVMCRLYWRQHRWYQMEELGKVLGKDEGLSSPDLYNMITSLVSNGLITQSGSGDEGKMDFDDYTKLLKTSVLQQICKELKLKMKTKQDSVDALRAFCKQTPISNFYTTKVKSNRDRVLEILRTKAGQCFKISDLARTTFYNLLVLMYLGIDYTLIREKRLELALIHDKIKRETYPIDKEMVVDDASVVFQNREEFYRYLQAHTLYEEYLETAETNDKVRITIQAYNSYNDVKEEHMLCYKSLPEWLRRFTPPNVYVKIMEDGVQELKKLKSQDSYELAVNMLDVMIAQIAFRQHKKASWYAEKALILHNHLNIPEKAANILLEGFKSDLSEEVKHQLRPRAKKIANQQNKDLKEMLRDELLSQATRDEILERELPQEHIYKQPKDNYNQKGKLKFEAHTKEGRTTVTAEEYCLLHYVNNGEYTHGEHWEGRIVSTIFSLLFWDIIYTKPRGVSGIFISHFQKYPLDMFSKSFYLNRQTLIEERLLFIQECTEDMLENMMQAQLEKRPQSEISDARRVEWEDVRAVTSCLGARALSAICRRLALDYGYAHSGFPDLTLWNIHTKKIKFVEVKTDADKPSMKQLQWLRYLSQHGIDAGFCYVGVNTTRTRARASDPPNTL